MGVKVTEKLEYARKLVEKECFKEAEQEIEKLKDECCCELTATEIGYLCSALFNSPDQILIFITKQISNTQLKLVREQTLSLILEFVQRHSVSKLSLHDFQAIHTACSSLFRVEKASKNKEKALLIVKELVRSRAHELEADDVSQLVNLLYEEIAKPKTKSTSTVQGLAIQLVGVITRYYPELIHGRWKRFLNGLFLTTLENEMVKTSKSPDHKLIEGSLLALHSLLFAFVTPYDECDEDNGAEDRDWCKQIYRFTRLSLECDDTTARFKLPQAGLRIFTDHAGKFGRLLLNDYKSTYRVLVHWSQHSNSKMKHHGWEATQSFLVLVTSAISSDENCPKHKQLFNFLAGELKRMLDGSAAGSKSEALAIRGYGYLAGPCRTYLDHDELMDIFKHMIRRCENIFLRDSTTTMQRYDDGIHQLPSFIDSLANIALQIENSATEWTTTTQPPQGNRILSQTHLTSLEQLSVRVIDEYPRLPRHYANDVGNSLIALASSFHRRFDRITRFLDCIVFQGLIRTCSRQPVTSTFPLAPRDDDVTAPVADDDGDVMGDSRTISHRSYIPLWRTLLGSQRSSGRISIGGSKRKLVAGAFANSLVKSLLKIVAKLNLKTKSLNNDEDEVMNPEMLENLEAENCEDFRIFVNLVQIITQLLRPTKQQNEEEFMKLLENHLHHLLAHLIPLSIRHPFVSGFYTLLGVVVRMAVRLNYFQQNQNSTLLLHRFVQKVVVFSGQFKGELLISVLIFFFQLPTRIADAVMNDLLPFIQRACHDSLSLPSLADDLLQALERWRGIFVENRPFLARLLPSLQHLLSFNKDQDERGRLNERKKKKKKHRWNELEDPKWMKIRSRVVRFMGRLGCIGDLAHLMEEEDTHVDVWDDDVTIEYELPLRDMKPVIKLEKLLPRVIHLACKSNHRKRKLSACELLHSIALFTIGTNAQHQRATASSVATAAAAGGFVRIYSRLFPALLHLAADVDSTCRQMFRPLVDQVVHWFTKNRNYENPETIALLNAIMDGLVDEHSATLRELCADSTREFLSWSIKQNAGDEKVTRRNGKSLLKRLINLCSQPSPSKRLGACLAFNRIYPIFREQHSLVDEFTFELIVAYLQNLSLSTNEDQAQQQHYVSTSCNQVIGHLERIVIRRSDVLGAVTSQRRTPKGFASAPDLACMIEWLFAQTSSTHAERRRKCMHLFCEFSALIATPSGWIGEKRKSRGGAGFIVSIYEEKLVRCHRRRSDDDFLTFLLTALEGYSWLIQEKFVSPSAFVRNDWKLLNYVKNFIDDVSTLTMEERMQLHDDDDDSDDVTTTMTRKELTSIEISIYNERKCTVTSRTLQFFVLLLRHKDADDVIKMTSHCGVWNSLVGLLLDATVSPSTRLGYMTTTDDDVTVVSVATQLSALVCDLIQVVMTSSSLGSDLIGRLRAGLRSRLNEFNLLDSVPLLMTAPLVRDGDDEAFRLADACHARLALRQHKLDTWLWSRNDLENEGVAILREIYRHFDSSVLVSNYHDHSCVKLLIETFLDKNSFVELATLMLDDTSRGQNFRSYFSHEIYTSMYGGEMVKEMRNITNISLQFICLFLCGLLDHLDTNKEMKKDEMCDEILGCWDTLILPKMWRSQQEEDRILVLDVLKKLVNIQPRVCHDKRHFAYETVGRFYLEILGDEKISLSFKNHALDLVRYFAPGHPVDMSSQLERFAAAHLSIRSRDLLPITSAPYVHYMATMRVLCDSFVACGHVSILKILVYVACREEDTLACDVIQTSIQRASYKMKLKQVEILEEIFRYFHQSSDTSSKYSISFRTRSVNLILLPLLESCDVVNLTRFYVNHINEVMSMILSEWVKYPEAKWREELEMRSCSYQMIDVLFKIFHRDQLSSSSQIGRSYSSSDTGNDESIIKSFLARANKDRMEVLKAGDALEAERRRFQCCLQNSLISALICTQDNEKWFKTFIFSETPRKRISFLDNLIDCSQVFEFQVELDEALERRKKFVAAKPFRSNEKKEAVDRTRALNYIESQTSAAASSLEIELSAFDYNFNSQTASSIMTSSNHDDDVTQSSVVVATPSGGGEGGGGGCMIELEHDQLNSHPCMPAMIALVKHLLRHRTDDDVTIPSWMTCLRDKLMTSSCHPNIGFFIVRVLVECSHSLKKYAGYWMGSIIQTITTEDWARHGIDYFFCDVLVMLISWSGQSNCLQDSLQDRQMTGALIEKLIRHIHHDKRAVLRHNVTLLKTLLECWSTSLVSFQLNTAVTYTFFNSTDLKLRFTGLQVIGALLANQVSPFSTQFNIHRDAYYSKIVRCMLDKHRNIYEAASEVCGLLSNQTDEEVEEMVYGMLTSLRGKEPKAQFVVCLNKVAQHHHLAVDRFVPHLVFMLNELHGELLTICLETLLIRAGKIEDLYSQLRSKKLLERLSTGDFPLQRAILRIYASMMTSHDPVALTDAQIVYFLPEVARQFDAASCPDPECRQVAYDVMTLAYQQQEERVGSEVSREIRSISKQFLIKSIDDPEDVLRTRALNFWNDERRLATEPCGKLIGIFDELYSSEIVDEERFPANLLALLLHSSSLSPDFEAPVFKHKLAECQFQEYEIKREWRNDNETSVPLFVETIKSTIDMDNSYTNKQQNNNNNQVLETAKSLLFTPTVDGGKETFDWMTGTSLSSFSSSSSSLNSGDHGSKSSLIAQPTMTSSSKLSRHNSIGRGEEDDVVTTASYARLRRRFVKDSAREGASAKFAKIHENKKRRETILRKIESKKLEMDVKLHRKYRDGELPDIQIPNKSIVAPLAGACQYDAKLSSVVMTTLVIAVIDSASKHEQLQEKVGKLRSSLNSIIGTSEEKNANLMGAVLSIAYHSPISYMDISEVVTSSITSYQHSVGIMLLEKGLLEIAKKKEDEEEEPVNKKRRTLDVGVTSYEQSIDEQLLWIQLARLYKSLGDYDVTKGIFSTESNRAHDVTKQGLTYESDEMYREAKKFYQQILQDQSLTDVSDVMREFWQDGCINATSNLARWKLVSECCDEKLNYYCDEDDVDMMTSWKYIDYQERYLPTSLQSKVLVLLQNNNNDNNNKLQEFVDNSMKSPAHRSIMERKYSHHLATLFAYQNDMGSARHYLSSAIENLARHWSTLSPLMTSQRVEATRMICLLSDMSDFVDVMEDGSGDCSKVEKLICDWSKLMPHPLYDSIQVWSSLLTYRSFFADQLIARHGNLASWITEHKCHMQMKLAKAAIKQKNFGTTARLLSDIKLNYLADMSDETGMKFSQLNAKYYLSRAHFYLSKREDDMKTMEMLLRSFDCLNEHEQLLATNIENKASVAHMRIFAQLLDVASQTNFATMFCTEEVEQAMHEMIGDVTDANEIERKSFNLHLKSLHISDRLQLKSKQEILLQLAQFCDRKLLENKQESDGSRSSTNDDVIMAEYAVTMTKCVLRSMHNVASFRADDVIKLSFARLLQLCEEFGDQVATIFIEQSSSVPSWMFLGWIGHLVALLDGEIASSVHDVIWRLSRDYPQAVVYPLKAAMSGFQEKRGKVDSNRKFVNKLEEKLCREIPHIETLIEEFSHICNPVIQLQDWLESFSKLLRSGSLRLQVESYQKMYEKLFGFYTGDSPNPPPSIGRLRWKFAKTFGGKVGEMFGGAVGSNISSISEKQVQEWRHELGAEKRKYKSEKLAHYSPWLNDYQSNDDVTMIEIPGQYNGREKPDVSRHRVIIGFDDDVTVMDSIRQPCKMTIRSSDEGKYPYLIKAGEDLRQDERIETIFQVFNDIISNDVNLRGKKDFLISTYQVVPLNSNVGMIEWVNKTKTLSKIINHQARKLNCDGILSKARTSYLPPELLDCDDFTMYGEWAKLTSRGKNCDLFQQVLKSFPADILRRAYMQMSCDLESFVTLRKSFVTSYSVMCISNWLLGIGDRHLNNILISMETGRVLGIDFGHAFGSATEILPVPEMTPFRLTRQIASMTSPHRVASGEMREVMRKCLKIFRWKKHQLEAIFNIFLHDPSVEWDSKHARKLREMEERRCGEVGGGDHRATESDRKWYAKRKMKIVKMKLQGAKSSFITKNEIEHNVSVMKKYGKYYIELATGDSTTLRRSCEDVNLDEHEQVDCLIEQATDNMILSRTYAGWSPWL